VNPKNLHVNKFKNPSNGKILFYAYDSISGDPVSTINDYILSINDNVAFNSLSSIFYSLKKFYEYLNASFECLIHLEDYNFQPAILTIIKSYPNYLYASLDTSNAFYAAVRGLTGHTPVGKSSVSLAVSHINSFLEKSHDISRLDDYEDDDLLKLSRFDLHATLLKKKNASNKQLLAMKTDTVMGAVIRKIKKNVTNWTYLEVPKGIKIKNTCSGENLKAFPFDHFNQLLQVAQLREKLLYIILGGAGLRTHEAMQIRTDDFDKSGNLLIRDFNHRITMDGMSEVELSEFYSSKGRSIERVFWIPTYEAVFRKILRTYLDWRSEQLRRGGLDDHKFLFVTSTHKPGRALYDTQRTSHIKTFTRNAGLIGLEGYGKHSLRHMYGVYMHNFFPTQEGKGLSIQQVNKLMGHATMKATEIYAQVDKNELFKMIESANAQLSLLQWEEHLKK